MGTDTTPSSDEPQPDRPENAPRWFLLLILVVVVLGVLWLLWSFYGGGRAL